VYDSGQSFEIATSQMQKLLEALFAFKRIIKQKPPINILYYLRPMKLVVENSP
jgi:hypothetical protein